MNIKVIGKNIEITDAIRDYVSDKADRLEKFEGDRTELTVTCSVEREEQVVEMQLNHNGEFIRIEERNTDLYASIDLALDRVERQMRRSKEKMADRNKMAEFKDKEMGRAPAPHVSKEGEVTSTRTYSIKPLALEDAKLELAESDNMFLTYIDASTKEVNVLYKKPDGTFGIVIPE